MPAKTITYLITLIVLVKFQTLSGISNSNIQIW